MQSVPSPRIGTVVGAIAIAAVAIAVASVSSGPPDLQQLSRVPAEGTEVPGVEVMAVRDGSVRVRARVCGVRAIGYALGNRRTTMIVTIYADGFVPSDCKREQQFTLKSELFRRDTRVEVG